MTSERLHSKFVGALLGTFVGDALGMPVENWSPRRIALWCGEVNEMQSASAAIRLYSTLYGLLADPQNGFSTVRLGRGSYTDDTEMMIGVAESLVACDGFDGVDMAQRFGNNFDPRRGYGPGAASVISSLQRGIPWNEAGARLFEGSGSFGNGAAMRIAPVGVFYHNQSTELRRVSALSASITHTHELGKEGAILQATAIACATRLEPADDFIASAFLSQMQAFDPHSCEVFQREIRVILELLERQPSVHEIVEKLGNDITAYNSVPTAIYSFLSHPHSFKDAVVSAVSLGGDADTIGAMTGAIAGAYHGTDAIPGEWLAALENKAKGRDYVRQLSENLFRLKKDRPL